jgi:hypothetical protein
MRRFSVLGFILFALCATGCNSNDLGTSNLDPLAVDGGTVIAPTPSPSEPTFKGIAGTWTSTTGPIGYPLSITVLSDSTTSLRAEDTNSGYGCDYTVNIANNILTFIAATCDGTNPPFPLDLSELPGLYEPKGQFTGTGITCTYVTLPENPPANEGSDSEGPYCFSPVSWAFSYSGNTLHITGPQYVYDTQFNGVLEGPATTFTFIPSSTPISTSPSPTPTPSSSPVTSPLVATISCPDTSSEPIQNLTIYNGSGGISINSGNEPYLVLGDNPSFTLEYSNISFVYDVTITASQFIFNSLNEVITPGCSDGWGPGLLAPFGIVMQRPCAQDLVFTPFEASYSVSCVDSSLGGGLLLNLNLGSDTVSFWTNQ